MKSHYKKEVSKNIKQEFCFAMIRCYEFKTTGLMSAMDLENRMNLSHIAAA